MFLFFDISTGMQISQFLDHQDGISPEKQK